ncbi:putative CVNH domain-containing protein [Colletotrichum sublineola]|uniref:Putative CVNH domain-containing protein n=1 Tax=Colletotrichum sublineola TaxID=1173701 RepID=A0A066XKV0_COLSU|nr:putative CVNH domain-containing protein [Colletotrichum sublineola]
MKAAAAILALLATVVTASDFSKSCVDEHIEPSTQTLTANCNTGDGKGTFQSTSLDLNSCFAYVANSIRVRKTLRENEDQWRYNHGVVDFETPSNPCRLRLPLIQDCSGAPKETWARRATTATFTACLTLCMGRSSGPPEYG